MEEMLQNLNTNFVMTNGDIYLKLITWRMYYVYTFQTIASSVNA